MQKSQQINIHNPVVAIFISFVICYIFYYFIPTFYVTQNMGYFEGVPRANVLGIDYTATLQMAIDEFSIPYSPFVKLLFGFFAKYSFTSSYYFITALTIAATVGSYYLIYQLYRPKEISAFAFFLTFSIVSYGFLFEIERGQWNIIAIFFVLLAIYWSRKGYFYLAVLFFAISVSLKLYPLVFAPALIQDFSRKGRVVFKSLVILFSNLFLFLIMGISYFNWYLRIITKYAEIKSTWVGNHSISSFGILLEVEWAKYLVFILYLVLLLVFLVILYRKNQESIGAHFLCVLAIGACIVPSVSHDYKLSILDFFIPIIFMKYDSTSTRQSIVRFLIVLFYFSIHYSYVNFYYIDYQLIYCKIVFLIPLIILIFVDYLLLEYPGTKTLEEPIQA